MSKSTVATLHPKYSKLKRAREPYVDVVGGTDEIREKGNKYLRQFHAEPKEVFRDRLKHAYLHNLTAETRRIYTGLVFYNGVKLTDAPARIEDLKDDIDNDGTGLAEFAREVFKYQFEGHVLILTDVPPAPKDPKTGKEIERSLEDDKTFNIRPYFRIYDADSIINWDETIDPLTKKRRLNFLVLREATTVRKNRWEHAKRITYRVLEETKDGIIWEKWLETVDENTGDKTYKRIANGQYGKQVQEIPYAIAYGERSGKGIFDTKPPLVEQARQNIRHYNKLSNYDALIDLAGVPVPYAKDLLQDEKKQLVFGANKLIKLGKEGEFGWAQIDAQGFDHMLEGIRDNESKIRELGANLLDPKDSDRGEKTAREVLEDTIRETATVRVMATSTTEALEKSFGHACAMLNISGKKRGTVELDPAWNVLSAETLSGLVEGQRLEELEKRLDVVNKAENNLTPAEKRQVINPDESEEDRNKALAIIATQNPVIDNALFQGSE